MPTIKDIAREAGVSHGTVSNVLNKTGKVSVKKIQLVEEAARRLGYVPNVQAQMLRQGTPTSVAVILPSLREDMYLDLYTALQFSLSQRGYDTLIYTTDDIAGNEEAILEKLPLSSLAAVAAVSCISPISCALYDTLPCPTFFIERKPAEAGPNSCFISLDFSAAGAEIGQYIRKKGWKRVAFFSSPNSFSHNSQLFDTLSQTIQGIQDSSVVRFSSDLNLALNKAFDIIQYDLDFDVVITTGFQRAQAVSTALQLSHSSSVPQILTLSSTKPFLSAGITAYEMDYSELGARTADCIIAQIQKKAPLAPQTTLAAKGFPFVFSNIKKSEPQTLTMLTLDSPSTNALKKLLPMFEAVSGISLKLVIMPYDDLHTQLNLLNSNFSYDLIRMDVAKFDDMGEKVYLPFSEAGITPQELPPMLTGGAYNNYSLINQNMYALPFDPSVQIFLYRSDLFEDTTLCRAYYEKYHEPLSVPTTFEQYLRVAEFFTAEYTPGSPTRYGATITCGSAAAASNDFLPYYLSSNTPIWQKDLTVQIDTPEMVNAMKQYYQMTRYASQQQWWRNSVRQFAEGMTATTIIYSNYAADIINSKHSSVVGKIGAAIVPGEKPLLGGGVVGISRYSSKIDACRKFFQWYYSPDVASLLIQLGGTSPLADTYNNFKNFSIFPWLSASRKSFEKGTRGSGAAAIPGFSNQRYEFAVGTAVRNLVSGIMTAQEAAAMAQTMYENVE